MEKLDLQSERNRSNDVCLDLAQEASQLAECYNQVHQLISHESVHDYVPYSWASLVQVKREYYGGMAHFYVASSALREDPSSDPARTGDSAVQLDVRLPKDENERTLLGLF